MSVWENSKPACIFQRKNAKEVFNLVMTPGSIPKFTIPSLDIQEGHRVFQTKKSSAWRSHQWHSQDGDLGDQMVRRNCSNPICQQSWGSFSSGVDDLPDPVTRAAMSLPHLAKLTTPYGFVTLGESPQVANEESVFFQMGVSSTKGPQMCRSSNFQEARLRKAPGTCNTIMDIRQRTENPGDVEGTPVTAALSLSSKFSQKLFQHPNRSFIPKRSSIPVTKVSIVQDKQVLMEKQWSAPNIYQRSNSFPKISTKQTSRNLLQTIIKKHFSNRKQPKHRSSDSQ